MSQQTLTSNAPEFPIRRRTSPFSYRQVPEGVYRIGHLNPNSSYHLSMKVDYPNAFDRRMAQRDRRTSLGGDIFI